MQFDEIIKKVQDGSILSRSEIITLLNLNPDSTETLQVLWEADDLSKKISQGKAEVHAQFAANLAPCSCDCLFCSFASINGIFKESTDLTIPDAVANARQYEIDGANAVYIMSTAHYSFERFIEMSQEIRHNLKPETIMIANIGDQSSKNAKRLKDAGYTGVYHVQRLREGIDTSINPQVRKKSILNFKGAGLKVGTCVEPIGPEHTNEEIADLIEFTASLNPSFSGAMRRVPIPGTEMAKRGMISELRLAQIVAVTRLGMPKTVLGNCIHEPYALGARAGANLFWAEVGANPRYSEAKSGETIKSCRAIFHESKWNFLDGPSRFFN